MCRTDPFPLSPGPVIRLGELDWTRPATDSFVLLVPLGSTEQHGPHLPVSTDAIIAGHVAAAAAAGRSNVVVAPTMPYGASGEHQGFAGTLSIGTAALTTVIVELVRSASASFAHTVLVNGHGGNVDALRTAVSQLRTESHHVSLWVPSVDGDAHAGLTETSILLHLVPHLVDMSRAEPGATAPISELMPALRKSGVIGVSSNGVLGDPTGATEHTGAQLFEQMADSLRHHLDAATMESDTHERSRP